MKKRIISMLMAVILVIGMFPITALAFESPWCPGVEFIVTSGGETVEAVYDGEEFSEVANTDVEKYVVTLPANATSFTISHDCGMVLASRADMNFLCMGEQSCTVEVSGSASYIVGCPVTGATVHLYIEIAGGNRLVTFPSRTGYTVIGEKEVADGENYSFTVELQENWQAGKNFAVKVNGEVVGTEPGSYIVENVTKNLDIKVVGVEPVKSEEVTVYFSVEEGDHFVEMAGNTWILEEVTIPYFDLANYGMEYLYYNPDCYDEGGHYKPQTAGTKEIAENNVTLLHMLIWLTEVYWHELDPEDAGKGYLANEGNWDGFSVYSATAGSAFFRMWDFDYNFNYYVNYEYPLGAPGWGSTCDQIRLFDGDVVSIRYNDNSGKVGTYHHFGENGLVSKTVKKGEIETIELELFYTGEDSQKYTTPVFNAVAGHNIYLMEKDSANVSPKEGTLVGTTDAEGKVAIDITKIKTGSYYLVSDSMSPAVMLLDVVCEHEWGEWKTTKEPTYSETGIKERKCDICDEKEEEIIPKKNKPSSGNGSSNKPNTGVTVIVPGEKHEDESNPNTGAPVFDLTVAGIVVLAAVATFAGKKNR